MRALAIIVALLLGVFAVAFAIAVVDGYDIPTCGEVRAGEAQPHDGDCADTGKTANAASNVTGSIAAGLGLLSVVALFLFGVTGNRPWVRRFVVLLVAGVVVFGLTALITNA